jgi:DNA polymerase V
MTNNDKIDPSDIFQAFLTPGIPLPSFLEGVSAGFPSPANDYIDKQLDLNELVIKHPSATFFVRVSGDSMVNAGIQSGDVLVVDRALEVSDGKIVIAVLNGEFTVKRIRIDPKGSVCLLPENASYKPIEISAESDFQVWGVVTYVIHKAQ